MKLKIPLWSFDRTPNQHSDIIRNRYVIDIDTSDYAFFNVVHEVFHPKMEWHGGLFVVRSWSVHSKTFRNLER